MLLFPLSRRRRAAHRTRLCPKFNVRTLLRSNDLHRQFTSLSPSNALASLSTEFESWSTTIAGELGDGEDVGIGGVGSDGDD